jgi:hypothetical protein
MLKNMLALTAPSNMPGFVYLQAHLIYICGSSSFVLSKPAPRKAAKRYYQ